MQRALNAKDDILVSWRYQCERSRATELEGSMFANVFDSLRQASVSKSRKTEIAGRHPAVCLLVYTVYQLPKSVQWAKYQCPLVESLFVCLQLIRQRQVHVEVKMQPHKEFSKTFGHSQHRVSRCTASRPQLCACDQGASLSRSSWRSNRIANTPRSKDGTAELINTDNAWQSQ